MFVLSAKWGPPLPVANPADLTAVLRGITAWWTLSWTHASTGPLLRFEK